MAPPSMTSSPRLVPEQGRTEVGKRVDELTARVMASVTSIPRCVPEHGRVDVSTRDNVTNMTTATHDDRLDSRLPETTEVTPPSSNDAHDAL